MNKIHDDIDFPDDWKNDDFQEVNGKKFMRIKICSDYGSKSFEQNNLIGRNRGF